MTEPSRTAEVQPGTILVVDDIAANRNMLRKTLEPHGYEVLLVPDGETAIKVAARARPDVILLDVMMPGLDGFETCRRLKASEDVRKIPVIFITAVDEMQSMVEGFRSGGVDYITKPFRAEEVLIRVQTHLQNARLTRLVLEKNLQLENTNEQLRREIKRREQAEASFESADERLSLVSVLEAERWGINALIGTSRTLARIVESVRKLQSHTTPVLILGESGTGKELIARALHFGGARAKGPFLPVNCSAVPGELWESLFFGHVKGAFSGASENRRGYFQNAHGGTLFLDEIADMPLLLQAKLLRVLETGFVLPLGAAREVNVDVRVISATNADLQAEIAAGKFRQDLYFRLARFVTELPPLRERREDVLPLAEHFVKSLSREMGFAAPRLTAAAAAALQAWDFPGNVRELKNLIERALIESGGGDIEAGHLGLEPLLNTEARSDAAAERADPPTFDSSSENARILGFVAEHGNINNTQCRELLGVGIHRAWYLLRKLQRSGKLQQLGSRRWTSYRAP